MYRVRVAKTHVSDASLSKDLNDFVLIGIQLRSVVNKIVLKGKVENNDVK